MSDGTAISPEGDLGIKKDVLQKKEGITLYKSNEFNVFIPPKPKIPLNEGLNIQVSSKQDALDSPKEVLGRYSMALGAANLIAESGITQDVWANTRVEEGQVVSAYGRVPETESSWRKPVSTVNRDVSEKDGLEPYYDTKELQKISNRWFFTCEKLTDNIQLFKNGVNGKDVDYSSREGPIVWENDQFTVEIIAKAPHIKGLHLVVHPKESIKRQWQIVDNWQSEQPYLQKTLEATAIAMGIQTLLAQGKGEIHNSGNWAPDLKSREEGGKLNFQKLSEYRNWEKRIHRPDFATSKTQIRTGMHAHVYIPENDSVILPEMSKAEAVERGRGDIVRQWESIPPTSEEGLKEIKTKLGEGKLTTWLENNCVGKLNNIKS
jgi:hypothetical protein